MAAKYVIKTGNLSAAIVETLTKHANGTEFSKFADTNKPIAGMRYSFVTYRIEKDKKAKADLNGTELPQPYSIVVPALDPATCDAEKLAKFQADLLSAYQDKVLHNVADGKSTINPLDLTAIIDDYYDRSRVRDGYTQAAVMEWYDTTFSPAYNARVLERNESNKKDKKGKIQTDQETTNILANNRVHYKALAKSTDGLDIMFVKNVISTLEKLIELEHLDADDSIALWMLEQAKIAAEKTQAYLDMGA